MLEDRNNTNLILGITPIKSKAIDEYIEQNLKRISSKKICQLYSSCFKETLEKKIVFSKISQEDAFVCSVNVPIMWLTQTCMQIYPYIIHCDSDQELSSLLISIFNRILKYILLDPFANAFILNRLIQSPWESDITFKKSLENQQYIQGMNKEIWERKFELSSIIFPFFIMCKYYETTKNLSFINELFFKALIEVIKVIKLELRDTDEENNNDGPQYFFQRKTHEPFDSLHYGRGNPCKNCKLIKSSFRCSDDACLFPYNIPENALVYVTFKMIIDLLEKYLTNVKYNSLINELKNISKNLIEGINKYGIQTDNETGEKFYVYEIDGYGNYYFMDEPRYPSLLSLPFFGFCDYNDKIYLNTRKRILSNKNPYFITGKFGQGESSAHSYRRYNGSLFTIMRGLTSLNENEVQECVELLVKTSGNLNYMYEFCDIDDMSYCVNPSFSYANSFFCILIDRVIKDYPDILMSKIQ